MGRHDKVVGRPITPLTFLITSQDWLGKDLVGNKGSHGLE